MLDSQKLQNDLHPTVESKILQKQHPAQENDQQSSPE